MNWVDVANAVAAGAAVAAAVTAAWQLRRSRNEALDARAAEIASVTVVPEIVERPTKDDHLAGNRVWLIKYHLHNPGRLPISNVHAVVTFPCQAQRHHYDGTPDAPSRTLELTAPVISPGGEETKTRRLSFDSPERPSLRDTKMTVTFVTPDAGEHTTYWPPTSAPGSPALLRRLKRILVGPAQ